MKHRIKPKQIILSKRANVFYLEHVRVMQKDDRIVYLNYDDLEIDRFFNIPQRNTIFILLGKGTSITDAAIRKLAESNVIVGFVGNGGSPLFASVDQVFLVPQSEYRPTEYMQSWMQIWLNDAARLKAAKHLQIARFNLAMSTWSNNMDLNSRGIAIAKQSVNSYTEKASSAIDTNHLMAVEGDWAKNIYRNLATGFQFNGFKREEGKQSRDTIPDLANSLIDHGNYIIYGYAASALNVLGISFSLAVMHGKTRRGALVFDIADVYKDAIVMPLAFHAAYEGWRDQLFRDVLIEKCHELGVLDSMINTIMDTINFCS